MEKAPNPKISEDEEEYSEYSTTSSSNNDSFFVNHVKASTDGNIFYVKCSVVPTVSRADFSNSEDHELFRKEYKRMSMRGGAPMLRFGAKKVKEKNVFGLKVLKKSRTEEPDRSVKEVVVVLNPKKVRSMAGIKILERVFGLVPSVSLAKKLVVAQVKEHCPFAKDGFVKPGDIIRSVSGEPLNAENVDFCLRSLDFGSSVALVFHEMVESSALNAIHLKMTGLPDILDNLHLVYGYDKPVLDHEESSFCVVFVSKSDMTPRFSFPLKRERNVLYSFRGSFLTLTSILDETFHERPLMTSFVYNRNLFHVSYVERASGLFLLAYNSKYCSPFEVKKHTEGFVALLGLAYHDEKEPLESQNFPQICELVRVQLITAKKTHETASFESCFRRPAFVALPKEIQLRIDDAISELEAIDFCNWTDSEDVIDALREFIIVGCALYFRSTLVTTHVSPVFMQEIETFIRFFGLQRIMEATTVKKMVVWHRIFPQDAPQNEKKKFLVFTSQGNLMMCAVLEEQVAKPPGPNRLNVLKTSLAYYVEEMQDILEYFRLTGVENLTRIWVNSNKRPEILKAEVQQENPQLNAKEDESESDSDWDDAGPNSGGQSSSGFDMSECSDIAYKDFQEIIPSHLTFGPENLLYHFVQIDFGSSGVLVGPSVQQASSIVNTFRKVACTIHEVFEKTTKFEQLLGTKQSANLAPHHRTLVAIKEHGVKMTVGRETKESFWVIGRLFHSPKRELYVCHRLDMPQNLVELAFKICISGAG